MDAGVIASVIAATLNAGTPLLIAAIGILIHEKSGVLNLGVEGMMPVSYTHLTLPTILLV